MGGLNSLTSVLGVVDKISSITNSARNTYSNYRDITGDYTQAKQRYELQEKEIAEKQDLDLKQMQIDREDETRQRKNALKRAVATRQAEFGGQGIDTADGSGEAVMLGLFKESSEEKNYRDRLNKLKQESLAQDVSAKRRRNLLSLQQNYANARDNFISNLDSYL